jgi:hypothetical protein
LSRPICEIFRTNVEIPILLGRHGVAPTRRGDAGQPQFRNRLWFKPGSPIPATESAYGRGGGVGRTLGLGPDLGVGVGLGVKVGVGVGVALGIAVAVAVGVGVGV